MHLAIDAVGAKNGGGATVLRDVVGAALADERIDLLSVFLSPRGLRDFDLPNDPRLRQLERGWAEPALQRLVWHFGGARAEVERLAPDALLAINGTGLPPAGVPTLAFVQQSLFLSPEALARMAASDRLRCRIVEASTKACCRRATRVGVQTETMRSWVSERFGLDPARIDVFLPSVAAREAPTDMPAVLAPMARAPEGLRVLYVGTDSPHKNFGIVLDALQRLGAGAARLFATLEPRGESGGVVRLGRLRPPELRAAYALATVLVFPSLVETVGLPLLEASAAGLPIVAADRPYAREVCGEAALYFDPLDAAQLASRLDALTSDLALRAELRRKALERATAAAARRPYPSLVDRLVRLGRGGGGGQRDA